MSYRWWEKEKDNKKARIEEQAKSARGINLGDSFLIVTEGKVTEPIYFKELRLQLRDRATEIKIYSGRKSDPLSIIKYAAKLAKMREDKVNSARGNKVRFDHVWAVIDSDVALVNHTLQQIITTADENNVKIAFSNPCFESWLIFHVLENYGPLIDGKGAKTICAQRLTTHGLTIKNTDNEKQLQKIITPLVRLYQTALQNASKHGSLNRNSPEDPSTEVHLLIQDIIYSLK